MMFDIFFYQPLFAFFYCLIVGIILFRLFRLFLDWNRNNNSPREVRNGTIVAKRSDVRRSVWYNGTTSVPTRSTTHYVTFECDNSERLEFRVKGKDYGHLVEGDQGVIVYQGSRLLEFKRN